MENSKIKKPLNNMGQIYYCEQCGRCSSACPITGVEGFNIRQIVRHLELSQIDELIDNSVLWLCLACGRCDEACPNGVNILELVRTLRKFMSKEVMPASLVPCVDACPIGVEIPRFIRMIARGDEVKALELILQRTPMPGVLGRVCSKPCESKCRRAQIDAPVSICSLKRYVSGCIHDVWPRMYKPGKETEKSILIIGSGPAGLSAAYYLRKKGHRVIIIEESNEAGGMLQYGIPEYRLPKSILNNEISKIISMGVDIRTNVQIDNIQSNDLVSDRFDAILIAIGLQSSYKLPLDNSFSDKVIYGLDFLKKVNCLTFPRIEGRVLVIGGGNVAVDVAMSSIRLGASNVILACLEKKEIMPADLLETQIAIEEGVHLLDSWGVKRFLKDGTLIGVELVECHSVFDANNNFNPQFGTKTMIIHVEQVIIAIGQDYDENSLKKISSFIGSDIDFDRHSIEVDSTNKIKNSTNIFAGGDVTGSSKSVVEAVASGCFSASSIDQLLGGDGIFFSDEISKITVSDDANCHKNSSYTKRQRINKLNKAERVVCFSEINRGLSKEQACIEASRCLRCDLEYALVCI